MARLLLALLLLLAPWLARAGEASWASAPAELLERPDIPAPAQGWLTIDGQYARVFAAPDDKATALRLANHAAGSVPRLGARLGVGTGGLVDIYLAPTQEIFSSVQPGVPPEWADGTAWSRLGLVFLRAPSARGLATTPLEVVLDHELVHILLGRAFEPQEAPRWLQEGLAQYYAGELGPRATELLVQAGAEGFYPLAQVTRGFPGGAGAAQLAYAESVDFIAWIAREHGEAALGRVVAAMVDGRRFEVAVESATGESAGVLEAAWRDRYADPWLKLTRYADMNWLFGIGAVAIVIGGYRRWRRGREKLRRWEREERAWAEAQRREAEQLAVRTRAVDGALYDDTVLPPRPRVTRVDPWH